MDKFATVLALAVGFASGVLAATASIKLPDPPPKPRPCCAEWVHSPSGEFEIHTCDIKRL